MYRKVLNPSAALGKCKPETNLEPSPTSVMEILYGQKRFNDVSLNTPLYTTWKSLQKIQSFGYMSVV